MKEPLSAHCTWIYFTSVQCEAFNSNMMLEVTVRNFELVMKRSQLNPEASQWPPSGNEVISEKMGLFYIVIINARNTSGPPGQITSCRFTRISQSVDSRADSQTLLQLSQRFSNGALPLPSTGVARINIITTACRGDRSPTWRTSKVLDRSSSFSLLISRHLNSLFSVLRRNN